MPSGWSLLGCGKGTTGSAGAPDPTLSYTTNLVLQLKPNSFSLNDGDAVGTWTDSSGAGNNVTQATTSKKPIFKTNILNGQSVVRFSAASVQGLQAASQVIDTTKKLSIFIVARQTSVADHALVTTVGMFNGDSFRFKNSAGTQKIQLYQTGDVITDPNTGIGANNWAYYTGINRGINGTNGTSTVRVNGTTLATSGSATGRNLLFDGNLAIGFGADAASNPLDGDIAEVLLYNEEVTGANLTTVESYLASKYGL